MAAKDLRFKVGEREFLIPADASGNYEEAAEQTDAMIAKGDKPEKGVWLPGSVFPDDLKIIAELQDLGVISSNFFLRPVVSGGFWYKWNKNLEDSRNNPKSEWLAWIRASATGRLEGTYVVPEQKQRLFFTNWSQIR